MSEEKKETPVLKREPPRRSTTTKERMDKLWRYGKLLFSDSETFPHKQYSYESSTEEGWDGTSGPDPSVFSRPSVLCNDERNDVLFVCCSQTNNIMAYENRRDDKRGLLNFKPQEVTDSKTSVDISEGSRINGMAIQPGSNFLLYTEETQKCVTMMTNPIELLPADKDDDGLDVVRYDPNARVKAVLEFGSPITDRRVPEDQEDPARREYICKHGLLENPVGITCDRNGRIYVSDWQSNAIQLYDAKGLHLQCIRDIESEKKGQMDLYSNNEGLAFDRYHTSHYLFTCNNEKRFVGVTSNDGKLLGKLKTEGRPCGVCIDPIDPLVIVTESNRMSSYEHDAIRVYDLRMIGPNNTQGTLTLRPYDNVGIAGRQTPNNPFSVNVSYSTCVLQSNQDLVVCDTIHRRVVFYQKKPYSIRKTGDIGQLPGHRDSVLDRSDTYKPDAPRGEYKQLNAVGFNVLGYTHQAKWGSNAKVNVNANQDDLNALRNWSANDKRRLEKAIALRRGTSNDDDDDIYDDNDTDVRPPAQAEYLPVKTKTSKKPPEDVRPPTDAEYLPVARKKSSRPKKTTSTPAPPKWDDSGDDDQSSRKQTRKKKGDKK